MEEIYHVCTRSIADFKIFNSEYDYYRIVEAIRYYRQEKPVVRFSIYLNIEDEEKKKRLDVADSNVIVDVVAYCIMPTHVHLLLYQKKPSGMSIYMNNLLNSYSKYFNAKHERKGPLWQGRFKKILVRNDEQLLHVTRYIHLNPVTAYLVDKPESWKHSSYFEYLACSHEKQMLCNYKRLIDMSSTEYRRFVEDGIGYQRDMAKAAKSIGMKTTPRRWHRVGGTA